MAYKITDSCVACGSCIGECPVEAISAGDIYVISRFPHPTTNESWAISKK